MPSKSATLGHLKMKVLLNKGFDVMIFVHDVATKFYQVTQIIL